MTVAADRLIPEVPKAEPTDYVPALPPCDLYSDEPEMESTLHLRQMLLLITCLDWFWRVGGPAERTDYFAAGNLTIYFSEKQVKNKDFRGPDFFVVKDVEQKERKSWTIWEEDGRYPDVIIEILSDSTAKSDRFTKKAIYQNTFRTPEYFWFNPDNLEFQGFCLIRRTYEAIAPSPQGWLWSDELQLFLGIYNHQVRYFTPAGELVPTPQESALLEEAQRQQAEEQRQQAEEQRQQAEEQRQQAEEQRQQAEERAERLAAKLRELNLNPDEI
jgi:Uma2 family endonuclease